MEADGRGKICSGMEGKDNCKGAALARGTFDLDPPTMGLGDGSGDAEAQPGAPFAVRGGLSPSVKPLKNPLLLFTREADARVRDLERCPFSVPAHGERHLPPGRGVFDPIVHEVQEKPSEAFMISRG